jgi:hypothetical protein
MFNLNLIKEFKSAGLVSKKLTERVILATDVGQTPAAIDPSKPQTDVNISGHSTADKPLADQTPAAAPAAPIKSQKDYLMNAATAAMSTAEACIESICEGKCFEAVGLDQARMAEMTEMYGKLKEYKGKMEAWSAEPAAAAVPNAPAVPAPAQAPAAAPAEAAPVAAAPAPMPAAITSQAPSA